MATKARALPSLDRLYELFCPDFAQGVLILRKQRGNRKAGEVAGAPTYDGRYLLVGIDYKVYLTHRVMYAMYHRKDPGDMEIDHIDGDKHNNRPVNLRLATRAQNGQNSRKHRQGPKGAYLSFKGKDKPWMSTITKEGVRHYLGSFYTEEEAHEAYAKASAVHHGEFGRAY